MKFLMDSSAYTLLQLRYPIGTEITKNGTDFRVLTLIVRSETEQFRQITFWM